MASDLDWRAIALLLAGKSGRAIRARVETAYHLACEADDTGEIGLSQFQTAILGAGDRAEAPDLVLSEQMMQQVEQRLDTLRNLPQALTLGLPAPKGLLLTGPSGVGKNSDCPLSGGQSRIVFSGMSNPVMSAASIMAAA